MRDILPQPAPALKRLSLAAGAALLLGVFTSPASAQFYVGPWGPHAFVAPFPGFAPGYRAPRERRLHPAMVVEDLEDRGFRNLVVVMRRPDVYVIEGISPRREPVRLIVDAYDGEILERFSRSPAATALAPLPTPPMRRSSPDAAPRTTVPPKVAGPAPEPRAASPAQPLTTVRPRSSDWAPINSVPVAPLE